MSGSSRVTASIATSLTAINVSAGTTSNNLSAVTFSNGSGISFGLNGSVVTASVATSLTAVNVSAGTTSNNLSAITFSNGSGVSFGLNGSVITGSVAAQTDATLSQFIGGQYATKGVANWQQSSLFFQPMQLPGLLSFSAVAVMQSFTGNVASVGSATVAQHIGIYTRNVSTLSLLMSTSMGTQISHSSTNSASINDGLRIVSTGWSQTLSKGDYFVGQIWMSTSSSQNVTIQPLFNVAGFGGIVVGVQGQASTNGGTQAAEFGIGVFKTQTAALPNSVAFSDLNAQQTNAYNPFYFQLFVTA
jgi:hypothetical protein